ncbi:MAG: polyketide cyclase [Actinomycetia bacterium]|nr:polyketide cyclase [Actinomycetes bacterium]
MGASGEVTVHIEAPPARVYALISNVTRMGEWSPECYRCAWTNGASEPAVGARFRGSNRQGLIRWTTTAEIVAAEPGASFAFTTKTRGDREQTRWRYAFRPAGTGTDVTESFESMSEPLYVRIAEALIMRNRHAQREAGMRTTLERIKAVAEAVAD